MPVEAIATGASDRGGYPDAPFPGSYWRSLFWFNVYRLIVATLLLVTVSIFAESLFGSYSLALFLYTSVAYILFGVVSFVTVTSRRPDFQVQLTTQVCGDVLFITVLVYASGGMSSGLGLLLLASLAAAGLISRGRLTLFYAALASIAVLLEQTYEVWYHGASYAGYLQGGLLSIGYFATAWLAFKLARYTQASEQLAAQREIDLANMAQVNQLVIQDMQDGVIVVDERGAIRQINRRAVEILGEVPKSGRELLLRDYTPQLATRLERWREDPTAGFDPLRTVLTQKVTGARFVPVGRSRSVGVVIFLEDLSRIQAQAQQMKLAAMGRLTANIAHEIRNPLSAINHATELLMEEPAVSETQGRLLQIIHDNSQRLDRMVQDVLKLNRRDRAHREKFALGEFLNTFVGQFCQIEKIPTEMVRLAIEQDATIVFDRSHLNQIMWNLTRNALRYCQRQPGSLAIDVRPGPMADTVELLVSDDGPGVPEALRSHLFEPFFTTAASGTGLGLYIAREIAQGNDATLDYVPQDQGAQFSLMLKGVRS